MEELLVRLRTAFNRHLPDILDVGEIHRTLDVLLIQSKQVHESEASMKSMISFGAELFVTLLQRQADPSICKKELTYVKTTVAHIIAEAAKQETCREICLQTELIPCLVHLLEDEDAELCEQALRAIGNLCYENDGCRLRVGDCGGVTRIIDFIRNQQVLQSPVTVASCVDGSTPPESRKDMQATDRILTVACGCLHNFANGNEQAQQALLDAAALPLLLSLLKTHMLNGRLCQFVLAAITSLTDSDFGKEAIAKEEGINTMLRLYASPLNLDNDILSLLSDLAKDSDNVKTLIAKSDILKKLIATVSLSLSQSSENGAPKEEEMKEDTATAAADLIVLVLSGDDALAEWLSCTYACVLPAAVSWLTSPAACNKLRTSAAFALGNIARGDTCVQLLLTAGAAAALIAVLVEEHTHTPASTVGSDDRAPLIYAIISAIRNLAVPVLGKAYLVEHGVPSALVPYVSYASSAVQAKTLAALRLLVNQHVAELLASDEMLLEQLVSLADEKEHNQHTRAEAMRLLAWLIKNLAHSGEACAQAAKTAGVVSTLLMLLDSEHYLMQNEAIIAMLLIHRFAPDVSSQLLASSSIFQSVIKLVKICLASTAGVTTSAVVALPSSADRLPSAADHSPPAVDLLPSAADLSSTVNNHIASTESGYDVSGRLAGEDGAGHEPATTAVKSSMDDSSSCPAAAASELAVKTTLHNCLLLTSQLITPSADLSQSTWAADLEETLQTLMQDHAADANQKSMASAILSCLERRR